MVNVKVPSTLRKVGRDGYSVKVRITNTSEEPLLGPIFLVIQRTNVDGLTVRKADGITSDKKPYIEFVRAGKKLAPERSTKLQKIEFESSRRLRRNDRRQFKLEYKVMRMTFRDSKSRPTRGLPSTNRFSNGNKRGSQSTKSGSSGKKSESNGKKADKKTSKKPQQNLEKPNKQKPKFQIRRPDKQEVLRVRQIQNRWTQRLMNKEGVVGVGTGLNRRGDVVISVFTERLGIQQTLPRTIEGVKLHARVVGQFRPLQGPPTGPPDGSIGQVNPGVTTGPIVNEPICDEDAKRRFDRAVPIGISIFNREVGCFSGTLGCRVRGPDGSLYLLSNNHVIAGSNFATVGDEIVQPGLGDTNCTVDPDSAIGTLADYVPLNFGGDATNTVDAAIALVTEETVGTRTPCDGYGEPREGPVLEAELGMIVQKYGRTTQQRTAMVTEVGCTTTIAYEGGNARFINQICVGRLIDLDPDEGDPEEGPELGAMGDSGSLVVHAPTRAPVGLLFAGSATVTICNPIRDVLEAFDVTIDGQGLNEFPDVPGIEPTAR